MKLNGDLVFGGNLGLLKGTHGDWTVAEGSLGWVGGDSWGKTQQFVEKITKF